MYRKLKNGGEKKNNLRIKYFWKFYVFVLSFKKDNFVLFGNEIKGS